MSKPLWVVKMCSPLGPAISAVEKTVGCFSTYIVFRVKATTELDLKVSGDLKDQMRNLMDRRQYVEDAKTQATRDGNNMKRSVEIWLKKVEEFVIVKPEEKPSAKVKWLKEVEEYVFVKPEEKVNKKQPQACVLNSCDLYKATEEVKGKIETIKDLLKESAFPDGMIDTKSLKPVEQICGATIQGQKTAQDTLKEVRKLLNDDGIRSIGIWGLAGIGKTTLVRTLNNELAIELENTSTQPNPFTIVIWATVSNRLDKDDDQRLQCLKRLQTHIACRLKMDMEVGKDPNAERLTMGEDLETMAKQLHRRLKNEKVLLILDDVWKKIDLDNLGIPLYNENKGCKIILTTRFKQVCKVMGINHDVKMNVFDLEEAEQLFKQKAKYEDCSTKIKQLAKQIVKECCGLPLAISVIGDAMKGTEEVERWRHALNELRKSEPSLAGIKDEVYVPLKYSFESLEDYTIKSCFLYCSLFPEDFSIEKTKLVEHWMAEGLIDENKNFSESMDEGFDIIGRLKESCLLEDGAEKDTVKMHDIVRDVAIWIASEDGCRSLVRSGIGLSEISDRDLSNSLKRVSFMNNEITKLPNSVDCHNASTLLLQHNSSLETVPEGFLQGFKAVRVLNLSSTNISSLPSSLLQLCDLRALILRECESLKDLPMLDRLCSLQMLDLHASGIREFPRWMEKLSSLRQLDLSCTAKLKPIKAGIISSLTSLEVLDMRGSAFDFCEKGREEKGQTTFEELKDVGRLCNLYIKLQGIPDDLSWINRLKKFQIFIGPKAPFTTTSCEKMVVIGGLDLTQELIEQLRNISSLESLTISRSKYQVKKCPSDPLPALELEELHLHRVSDLESIGHLGLNFHNLKSVEVHYCFDMKYLFSCVDSNRTLRTLPSLEEIQVGICNNLEVLFNYGSGQDMASDPVVPKLRKLKLCGLSKLSTLSRREETWPRLEEVEVFVCHSLIRLPLTNQNAETIKEIRGESHWWNALEWGDVETKSSLQRYFRHRRPTKAILRCLFYDFQHFLTQGKRSILNKTSGDEDVVRGREIIGCFGCSSNELGETDGKTERD